MLLLSELTANVVGAMEKNQELQEQNNSGFHAWVLNLQLTSSVPLKWAYQSDNVKILYNNSFM